MKQVNVEIFDEKKLYYIIMKEPSCETSEHSDIESHLPIFDTNRFYCLDGGFASSLQQF